MMYVLIKSNIFISELFHKVKIAHHTDVLLTENQKHLYVNIKFNTSIKISKHQSRNDPFSLHDRSLMGSQNSQQRDKTFSGAEKEKMENLPFPYD